MKSKSENVEVYYYNNNTLLVSTASGLIRVHCPFKATCIKSVETIKEGDRITVICVEIAPDKKLLYLIDGKKYYYTYFEVLTGN